MNLSRPSYGVTLIALLSLGVPQAIAGETSDSIAAQKKRDQKVLEKVNKRVERAVERLEREGEDIKDLGERMISEGNKTTKSAEKDRAKASEINDKVVRLRGEAAAAQVHGDNDKMNRLISESNDLEARSARLIIAANESGPAAEQHKALGEQIRQKGEHLKQLGAQAKEQSK